MSSTTKIFRNVRILPGTWRNFSGTIGEYNAKIGVDSHGNDIGKRYFSIALTEEMAEELRQVELHGKNGNVIRGCNIKTTIPKNEGDQPLYSLRVTFGTIPPEAIWRVVPRGRMALNLDTVGNLDHEFIDHADVKVSLSTYEKGPNVGITAYLSKLIVYIREDDFDNNAEFTNIPIIGGNGSTFEGSPMADSEDDLPF